MVVIDISLYPLVQPTSREGDHTEHVTPQDGNLGVVLKICLPQLDIGNIIS